MNAPGTSVPIWDSSSTNISAPSNGKIAAGFNNAERPPAGWFNWLFNLIFSWLAYFWQQLQIDEVTLGALNPSSGTCTLYLRGSDFSDPQDRPIACQWQKTNRVVTLQLGGLPVTVDGNTTPAQSQTVGISSSTSMVLEWGNLPEALLPYYSSSPSTPTCISLPCFVMNNGIPCWGQLLLSPNSASNNGLILASNNVGEFTGFTNTGLKGIQAQTLTWIAAQ